VGLDQPEGLVGLAVTPAGGNTQVHNGTICRSV
jgi:hypothetical protein